MVDTGAVFTFGKCKFNDNVPGKFWLRDDKALSVACGDEHTIIVSGNSSFLNFVQHSFVYINCWTVFLMYMYI